MGIIKSLYKIKQFYKVSTKSKAAKTTHAEVVTEYAVANSM